MIKVLIIDDEIWVCQLIQKLIDWESIGFQVIGEAHDGFEAMAKIKKERPELVLTDIRMPGYDGVELMKKAKEEGLDTQFIIISGHSDFGYAQEAIKYGALGYVLKPVDQEELLDFLQKTRERIFHRAVETQEKKMLENRLYSSLGQLKEQYFLQFFRENNQKDILSMEELNRQFGFQFGKGIFQVVLYQLDKKASYIQKYEVNEIMLTNLSRYLTEAFSPYVIETFVCFQGQRLLQILNYTCEKEAQIQSTLKKLCKKIHDEQKMEWGYELTIGAGSRGNGSQILRSSYESARDSLHLRMVYGIGILIEKEEYVYQVTELSSVFTVEDENRIMYDTKLYDADGLLRHCQEVFERIMMDKKISPLLILEGAREIWHIFLETLRKEGITKEQMPVEWENMEESFENCFQIKQVEQCLYEAFLQAKKRYEQNSKSRNDKVIEIAKKYICEHYKEDISLKMLADEVCLHPKYFGELFKKETGMNYSDYLIGYRMEIAEILLKDVRNRVNEVGSMVGYKDAKYFSRLFKKMTGLSPVQYRKLFS